MQFFLEIADVAHRELPMMSAAEGLYTFSNVLLFYLWKIHLLTTELAIIHKHNKK